MVHLLGMCNAQAVPVGGGRGAAGARRVQGTGGPGEAAQAGHGVHCAFSFLHIESSSFLSVLNTSTTNILAFEYTLLRTALLHTHLRNSTLTRRYYTHRVSSRTRLPQTRLRTSTPPTCSPTPSGLRPSLFACLALDCVSRMPPAPEPEPVAAFSSLGQRAA